MNKPAQVMILASGSLLAVAAPSAMAQSLFHRPVKPAAPAPVPAPATTPAPTQPGNAGDGAAGPGSPEGNGAGSGDRISPTVYPAQPGDAKSEGKQGDEIKPAAQQAISLPAPATSAQAAPVPLQAAPSSSTGGQSFHVRQVSLMAVIPPEPKKHQRHDKLEIIVNESSLSTSQQKLDANKKWDYTAELSQFPSLRKLLLESELLNGMGNPAQVGVKSDDKFKGDGKYERTDRMTARISGLVSDVKPNGLLFVEARESIQQDEEVKVLVISGLCDPKDVTTANTVQSSQLANLVIRVEHTGQIKDSATKGLIPRIFETLFNF